jgi:hypothetical protein
MPFYRIERVDVSYAVVEAENSDEALEIAERSPDIWDIDIGEPEVTEE